MYHYDSTDPSSHPDEGRQENTGNFQQYAFPPSKSSAPSMLPEREQVPSASIIKSPVAGSKKIKVEPAQFEPESMNPREDPDFRPRNQKVAAPGLVNSRVAAAKATTPAHPQGQGDLSGYQTYPPTEDGYGGGQPAQQQFGDNYNLPNMSESGGGVYNTLKSFMPGRTSSNVADYEKQRRQQVKNSLRTQLNELQQRKDEEVSRLSREIQAHVGEKSALQQRVRVLEGNNAKLHERCNRFDDDLKALQDKSLQHVSTGRWLAQDDRNTGATIQLLRDHIKQWALTFGIKNLRELDYLHGEDHQEDRANLNGQLGSIFDGAGAAFAPTDMSATKVTSMMLTAVLAHEIHQKVLSNPFFFLDGGALLPTGSVSLNVYNHWIEVNAVEAHQWRCKMIRALTELPSGIEGKPPRLFNFPEQKHAACTQLTNNFLSGPARFLLLNLSDSEVQARNQAVFEIWMLAGTLSTDLWTQLPYTKCQYLPDLQSV